MAAAADVVVVVVVVVVGVVSAAVDTVLAHAAAVHVDIFGPAAKTGLENRPHPAA